jgi:hypothetical protein
MANKRNDDLFDLLRARGLRRKVAKPLAALDDNRQKARAEGEKTAKQAMADLSAAVDDIRTRVLRSGSKRTATKKSPRKRASTAKKRTATRTNTAKKAPAAKKATKTRKKAPATKKATKTRKKAPATKKATKTRKKATKTRRKAPARSR